MNKHTKRPDIHGFTVIELLIVIIVIGILATIVFVSYNGVQNTGRTTQAQTLAVVLQKKIDVYNNDNGTYPADTTSTAYTNTLNNQHDTSIASSGIVISSSGNPVTPTNGTTTLEVDYCIAPSPPYGGGGTATSYKILYWDYTKGMLTTQPIMATTDSTPCATWKSVN